jgi:hypothetical protein
MTANNSELLNQINADLVQEMTDEQASTVAGGHRFISQLVAWAAGASDEPSGSIVECLVFDLGGDAVMFEGPVFLAQLPFISLASTPQ